MKSTEKLVEGLLSENVAATLLQQLHAFGWSGLPRWGANTFMDTGNGLQFRVKGRKIMAGGRLIITLAPNDTYTIHLWRVNRNAQTIIDHATGVHVGELAQVITGMIGA